MLVLVTDRSTPTYIYGTKRLQYLDSTHQRTAANDDATVDTKTRVHVFVNEAKQSGWIYTATQSQTVKTK
jgi:hypothetical protein